MNRQLFSSRSRFTIPLSARRPLELGERCLVMGILNVTPDSFAESEAKLDPGRAVEAALEMEAQGADLIDIGGESTRPGADPLPLDAELARVLPVMQAVGRRVRVPVSVDTYKAEVARRALDLGASFVNDVSGLRYDPGLAAVVAGAGAGLILLHTRGRPKTMYAEARYGDAVSEVSAELLSSMAVAQVAGVPRDRIVVDPGLGFAKQPEHSYGVLARLADVAAAVGRPVLVGPSRKSFLRAALGDRPAPERDWGTAAAVTAAVLAGAHIVRVHAVSEMVQVVKVAEQIRRH